jgi:small subunit ribosomal protein S1
MALHHVEAPEQVVTPGEELWVKIIDIDLDRRRISLSIKQAAEGGVVAAEYQDQFGEHAYDDEGNYIGPEIAPDAAADDTATAQLEEQARTDTEGALGAATLADEPPAEVPDLPDAGEGAQ